VYLAKLINMNAIQECYSLSIGQAISQTKATLDKYINAEVAFILSN